MKLHRFFIPSSIIRGTHALITDAALLNQLMHVLRLREGDQLVLLDGFGSEYLSKIVRAEPRNIEIEILEKKFNDHEPFLKITLYQSLIKKDHFEWVLQKCTEVGVTSFIPILSARSEKKGVNVERARKILKEAAEQSQRGIIPTLSEIMNFQQATDQADHSHQPTIFLHASGLPIGQSKVILNASSLNLFVGPEGGWTDEELRQAKDYKFELLSLGSRILRSETAGVVGAAIILSR